MDIYLRVGQLEVSHRALLMSWRLSPFRGSYLFKGIISIEVMFMYRSLCFLVSYLPMFSP